MVQRKAQRHGSFLSNLHDKIRSESERSIGSPKNLLAAVRATTILYYLFDQFDRRLEIQTEIDERPLYAFAFVLLLLKNEHEVIEKLLQSFVGVIYTELIETIVLYHDPGVEHGGEMETQGSLVR